ncbi:aspartic protease [Gymnopilus junonius]|uniref:Aspartic protease n=1 Tax=Gymnopilus junonius TaxID=109634 RepID=A0A9P5TL03_GYMJU|nr:aspartic protease [Gymnopilus junonius]
MFPKTLLTTLLLALSVAANPVLVDRAPVTVSFSRRVNATSVQHLVKHDQARARYLKQKGTAKAAGLEAAVISSPVDNQAVSYIASVGVGSPATTYDLIVDTGSSNTWVGAGTTYVKTSTSTKTSNSVSVSYGSGSFSGTEYTDTVTIGSGLTITKQSIGVASTSSGFQGVDGILGIGPLDLTQGTLSPASSSTIPTVTDNLFSQGTISADSIGISFEPSQTGNDLNGEITWGGVDSSKYTGSITYIPVTSTYPASAYWGINQSIRYGTSTTILSSTAGIVDTGTTLILIATNGFTKYKSATGATLDSNTGLLAISSTNFNNLSSLFFTTGGTTFELTANAQIWPRALNTDIGGSSSKIYLITADLGSNSGQGLDFINGQSFLERFYSVFDTANNRVGLATTPFTTATSN